MAKKPSTFSSGHPTGAPPKRSATPIGEPETLVQGAATNIARSRMTAAPASALTRPKRGFVSSGPLAAANAAPPLAKAKRKLKSSFNAKSAFHLVHEVAEHLRVDERTIYRDIADGLLVASGIRDTCRIADRDLKTYLRERRGLDTLNRRRRRAVVRKPTKPNSGETPNK